MVGFFPAPKLMGAISATAVIFAAMYLLTMYQKLMFGPLDKPENKAVRDIHGSETWVFGIVVAAALVMGLAPQPILTRSEKSVDAFVASYRDRLADSKRSPDAPGPRLPGAGRRGAGCAGARACSRSGGSRAMTFDVDQIFAYSPMLILIGMGCVILLAETFIQGKARSGLAWLGVAGCVAALAAIGVSWTEAATPTLALRRDARPSIGWRCISTPPSSSRRC